MNQNDNKSETEFLESGDTKSFTDTNMWSMLGNQEVKMNITTKPSANLTMSSRYAACVLRKKNPNFNEEYALKFHFEAIMTDGKHVSNKFIL